MITAEPARMAVPARQGQLSARVLVAEDNRVSQIVMVQMLERLGCQVDIAANGHEAVSMRARFPYDAVLMDCEMPELDGYGATEAIRRREDKTRRLPIIAVTAHALAGARERCVAAGMDDYLSKPVRRNDLEAVLQRWVPVVEQGGDCRSHPRSANCNPKRGQAQ